MKTNKIRQQTDHKTDNLNFGNGFIRFRNFLKNEKNHLNKYLCFIGVLFHFTMFGQSRNIQVTVSDESNTPIKGAQVRLIGSNEEPKFTDIEGRVNLDLSDSSMLRISFEDMEKDVEVNSDAMSVQLNKRDKKVNLGYGFSNSVEEMTSSISTVYAEDLERNFSNNPLESLYGQLSGLMVLQNGGTPWNRNPDLFIRGKGTVNNNSILVLVDGFERDLSTLALYDIKSVSVIKDGTALARFGQRGANGIIYVTTKKGDYNSFKVRVSHDQSWNFPFRKPKFLDAYNYANAINQASILDGNGPVYSDLDLYGFQTGENPYYLPNVNWFNETFRDFGTTLNVNTSFSGGSKNIRYFSSLNYQNERGLFDNTNLDDRYNSQIKFDRLNFRTNLDIDITNSTKFIVNVAGNIEGQNEPGARVGGVMDAIYSVPSAAFPVRTPNGEWGGTEFYDNNPVALVSSTGVRQPNGRQIMANGQIIQDLSSWVKGLSAEVALSYDNEVLFSENKIRDFLYESLSFLRSPTTGEISDTFSTVYGSETDLNYSRGFSNQFRQATLYGKINYEKFWNNTTFNSALVYEQDKRVRDGQYNTFLNQNAFLSASLGYKDRYFIDGVLSYSGSSVLPKNNRFGFFPAISAGWLLNHENFLKDSKTISYLKLRASWGMSGNNIMAPNLYDQGFYSGGGYFFTDNNNSYGGIYEGRLATKNLTYENSIKTNFGVDMELLDGLSITLDAFVDNRENILVPTNGAIPSLIGVATPIENAGKVRNKGFESSILWKKNVGDFKYHIGGNFTFAKNKIIEMNEEFKPYDYLKETGRPIGQQFGLQSLGFFKDQADINNSPQQLFSDVRPGDVKYKDQNNDGVIDNLDVIPMGYANNYPEIYYAFNFGYEMKGFGVDLLFQGIANQTLYLNTKSVFWPLRGNATLTNFSSNSWTPETANTATLPRLSLLENENNYRKNDIWLTRADYLKLRRFEIYYNFPEGLIKKLKLKKAKIYARGMNIISFDAIKSVDPEDIGVGYPTLTSYHLGVNLEF